jgi:hypothetical protein
LCHASRQTIAEGIAVFAHVDLFQAFIDSGFALAARNAIGRRKKFQEFSHLKFWGDWRQVGHIANVPLHAPVIFGQIDAVDENLTISRPIQVRQHF